MIPEPTPVEIGAKPKYSAPQVRDDPVFAFRLSKLEHIRFRRVQTAFLDHLRAAGDARLAGNVDAWETLAKHIDERLRDVMASAVVTPETAADLGRLERRHFTAEGVRDAVDGLAREVAAPRCDAPEVTLPSAAVAGPDAILETRISAAETEDAAEFELLFHVSPVENLWRFMRDNWLSNRVFRSHDDILAHCCDAWNKLIERPWRIGSIGMRSWAHET